MRAVPIAPRCARTSAHRPAIHAIGTMTPGGKRGVMSARSNGRRERIAWRLSSTIPDGHSEDARVAVRERAGRRQARPRAIVAPHRERAGRERKGARAVAPRSRHGEWEPAADRRDVVEMLEEQGASRVPELVPLRYGRMLVSPFTFFRGAAYPMAADLASAPHTGLRGAALRRCASVQLRGFAAPDRRLVFGINDFDETLPGPFEWDVKRLVASFAVAGRDRNFDAKQRRSINRTVTRAYREAITGLAGMSNLDLWYSRIEVDEIAELAARHGTRKQRKVFERNVAKARAKDSMRAFGKLTEMRRRRAQDRQRPAAHRPDRGGGVRRRTGRPRGFRPGSHPHVPAYPDRRSPAAARAVSLRARGAQGRRRGQCRDARVDPAHGRARRERSAVPAAQGGAGIGPRAVPGQELVRQARPAGRRGSATAAGRRRHHARLDPPHGAGRREPGLLHAPALGRQGLGAGRADGPDRR